MLLVCAGIATTTAAALLTCIMNLRDESMPLSKRFVYAWWRFAVPSWCFQEAVWWIVFGRLFP